MISRRDRSRTQACKTRSPNEYIKTVAAIMAKLAAVKMPAMTRGRETIPGGFLSDQAK
jgi:hypothetical protein